MATVLTMPGVATGDDGALIVTWSKQEGDAVAVGDVLLEIETEKAIVEMNAESAGVLARILVPAGQMADVGAAIGVLLAAGEGESHLKAALAGVDAESAAQAPAPAVAPAVETAPVSAPAAAPAAAGQGERIFASPLARRLARDANLDLTALSGSGPRGRIIKRDVLQAQNAVRPAAAPAPIAAPVAAPLAAAPVAGNYTEVPHSAMRRTIARRLTESKSSVPHFYLRADCRMDALLALRAQVNAAASRKVSVNDFIIKAVAAALREMPEMNVSWTDEALRQYKDVDISVAVSTDTGLLTPVVKGADRASISDISRSVADLAERARAGKLQPAEYQGGSFTISNLGMFGVDEFAAIINPPQAAILAVGAASQRVVVEDGDMAIAQVMTVTLSVDHRAIDGALAARWLGVFKRIVENPLSALI